MHITESELQQAHAWASAHFTRATMPFSFRYGERDSREFLPGWTFSETSRRLDERRTEITLTWVDPVTGLDVRCVAVTYRDFPAVEWTVYLRNTGAADTPLLELVQGLDARFARTPDGEFLLHHYSGDYYSADGYAPHTVLLTPGMQQRFAPEGGRASNVAFPYYNVQQPGGGLILAIGWPGQWTATFTRDETDGLRICAGQELTHLILHPGEEIRTPHIALLCWQGNDRLRAQNIWRRWYIAENMPRPNGELPRPSISGGSSLQFNEMQDANEDNQILFIDRYLDNDIPLDLWWMDAGWYPSEGHWWNTGTWEVDATRFPRGLRAVSDHAHARGIQALVWFEPERVTPNSWLAEQHPEWLLRIEEPWNSLLDLGNPAALAWLIEHIDALITAQGIDIYRQDFNFDPLPYWRAHDADDRQGISENHHVTGYLAYWDALRARHPALLIDSCASGGRRNDLETMRRAVPLHKTDYNYVDLPVKQAFHHTLFSWLPYFAAPVMPCEKVDEYTFHSAFCLFLGIGFDVRTEVDFALLRKLTTQWRRLAPLLYADYYPLTPFHRDEEYWMAWQFNRPEQGDGLVQAFRRAQCHAAATTFLLHDLEPETTYHLSSWDGVDVGDFSGRELMEGGLVITLPERPQAVIYHYSRS